MRRLTSAVLLAGLLAGCSLPLPREVKTTGSVPAEQRQGAGLVRVLPPGPKPGEGPEDVVTGFLGAQSNADDNHGIARSFLAESLRQVWSDDAEVLIYNPATLDVRRVPDAAGASDEAVVRVTVQVSGAVRKDGSFAARVPADVVEDYQLQQVQDVGWQLTDVPAGLRLTAADRQRAFRVANLHYLAPVVGDNPPQLVPDPVLLPLGNDPAATLVARQLQAPTVGLGASVTTAAPRGTRALAVRTTGAGTIEVDLSRQVLSLSGPLRQALSAQLVWTLRNLQGAFTGLRLTVEGRPFTVPDEGAVQDSGAWNSFDPEGLVPDPPLFFVQQRRLRALGDVLQPGPATAGDVGDGQAVPVDGVAITPDRTRVALLETDRSGLVTIRSGPLRAAAYPVWVRQRGLSSASWGSGDRGLWLLHGVADGTTEVLLATGPGRVTRVPTSAGPTGKITSLALSRDGARAALVAGGRLWVGRVAVAAGVTRLVDLTDIAPTLAGVSKVAWGSSTSLVVLARVQGAVLPVRVAVDGLTVEPLDGANRPAAAVAVAASPAGVVVASGGRLYTLTPRGFTVGQAGSAPTYPG